MIIEKFEFEISKNAVFRMLDCARDNPVYEQVEEEYNTLIREIEYYIEPKAGLVQGKIPKELFYAEVMESPQAIFSLLTVGSKGSELVTKLFGEGNYLAGMIADAMLDDYLFQMDRGLKTYLMDMAKAEGKGISKRLEAPSGIDIKIQKTIHQALDAETTMGVTIKESFMYDPVKSMGHVYLLSDEDRQFDLEHDCSKCNRKECKFKNYENNCAATT